METPKIERKCLSIEEAAIILGISRGHAYESAKDGSLPAIRMGKRWIVPAAAINKLIEPKD